MMYHKEVGVDPCNCVTFDTMPITVSAGAESCQRIGCRCGA